MDKIKELAKNKTYVIGFCVAVVAILAIVFFCVLRSTPEKSTKKFMDGLLNNKPSQVLDYLYYDKKEVKESEAKKAAELLCDSFKSMTKKEDVSYKIKKSKVDGKKATVTVTLIAKDGKDKEENDDEFTLKKDGSKWKVVLD